MELQFCCGGFLVVFFMVVYDSGLYICSLVVWEWYTLMVL
jgi:hypothetical protein